MNNTVNVLYQDEHIVVAVKPYGVLSEAHGQKPNMPSLLKEAFGCETVYPVHRLDRTTQGVMVYALTPAAARSLGAQIQRGETEKTYLAVAQGTAEAPSGELDDLLYFDRRKNKSYVVKRERKGVKQARLQYEVLQTIEHEENPLSLLKIRLLTGRTHQIRVQFASRKMPLVGDRRYGSRITGVPIALCAARLAFTHPMTGERMCFSCEPKDSAFAEFNAIDDKGFYCYLV